MKTPQKRAAATTITNPDGTVVAMVTQTQISVPPREGAEA